MGKKNLLNETTVRKFMKFADLGRLSDNFINETYGPAPEELEEQEEELDLGAPEGPASPVGDEGPEGDMGDEGGEGPVDPALADAIEAAIADFIEAGAAAVGADVSVTGEEGAEDLGPEDEMDFLPAEDGGEGPPLEGEEQLAEIRMIDTDAVIGETLRRVTSRLAGMNREEKLVERLAKKVSRRLNRR